MVLDCYKQLLKYAPLLTVLAGATNWEKERLSIERADDCKACWLSETFQSAVDTDLVRSCVCVSVSRSRQAIGVQLSTHTFINESGEVDDYLGGGS